VYIQHDLFTAAEEKLQRLLFEIGQTMIYDFKIISEREKSAFLREHIVETFNFVLNYGGQMAQINSTQTLLEHFKHMKINSSLVQSVDLEMRKVEFLCEVVGSDVGNFRSQLTSMYGMWEKLQSNVNSHAQFFAAAALLTARSGSYEIYANLPFAANVTSENYNDFMAYLLSLNLNTSTFLATANIMPTQNQLCLLNRIKTEQMNQSIAMEKKKDFVRYSGNYVLASQIQSPEIIQGKLVIMAAQKFFIDKDLILTDTHLTIMAPIVEVVGENRTLTLQGSSGQIVLAGRAPGLNGLNGKPGASSGDLKMYTLDVVNAQALTIRSKGGDGSDGQAGVHGTNGITSSSPKLTNNDLRGTESQIHQRVRSFNYKVTSWSSSRKNVNYASLIVFTTVSRDITRELTVTNYDGARAPTNGANGGNGGAAALPGNLKLLLKNTATIIAVQSLSGKNGEGGQGGKAGRDAATCASAAFKCHGSKENTVILVVVVTDNPYEYRCSLEHRYDCDSKFPSASGGKNGTAAATHEMRSYKVSVMTSTENEVHEYCKVAVDSAALEKGGLVNEFLDFVFSLPDAKSQLKDGICVKNQ
jgi:hypothetical protein